MPGIPVRRFHGPRRTLEGVAPDLPERTVADVPVPLTGEQATLYEAEVREALAAIERKDGIARQALVLRLLTVLKQICNHPAQYLHEPGPLAGRSGKLAALEELVDALAAEIGHAGALLEGEIPPEVATDAAEAGLDLLPGAGELQPRCSCPDWADPCKHAAAACYLVADAVDADPFGVLLLRGLRREEVLSGLRARRRRGSGVPEPALRRDDDADPGVPAREAWARARGAPGSPTVVLEAVP